MKARRASIWDLYNGAKQYVVPLFQRPYVWSQKQWAELWADITSQYNCSVNNTSKKNGRFLGSIVVIREYEKNLDKYTIIDGQQRITTISILLAVIRAFAKERSLEELYDQISGFLKNSPKSGEGQYVVIPTESDKNALFNIFDENYCFEKDSKIVECFDYFWRILDKTDPDLNILQQVITEDLSVVYIELDEGENANQVFESLNYRGVPLEESDLIRNFFFGKLEPPKTAKISYEKYWKPMEERLFLDQELLTQFLLYFFMRSGKVIRTGELFEYIRSEYSDASSEEILNVLLKANRYSCYFLNLWHGIRFLPDSDSTTIEIINKILQKISTLNVPAVTPFLLLCLDNCANNVKNQVKILKILQLCESYLIRRAVCIRADDNYENIFSGLCLTIKNNSLNETNVVTFFSSLKNPDDFPTDDEFLDHLKFDDLYHPNGKNTLIHLILTSLEEFFEEQSKNLADTDPDLFEDEASGPNKRIIEHVLPEEFSPWWKEHLSSEYDTIHQDYLNRLGNLTLTLENPAIASANFDTKKDWYSLDSLKLNNGIKGFKVWRKFQIDQRSQVLAALCVKIWPKAPEVTQKTVKTTDSSTCMRNGDISSKLRPAVVTINNIDYPVKYWYNVLEVTVLAIYESESLKFDRIIKEYPAYFSTNPDRYQSKIGDYSFKSRFGRYQVRNICLKMINLVGWSEEVWCLKCR